VRDVITDPEYLDVTVPAGTAFSHPTQAGHTVIAYVIEGQGRFCPEQEPFGSEAQGCGDSDLDQGLYAGDGTAVLYEAGDQVTVSTAEEPVRFLLISGQPIGEKVAWYGPIVMNTQAELRTAFDEYRNGTFIKRGRT
jgi:redox-sensitive bicupin YhaK (pirin superfamily)